MKNGSFRVQKTLESRLIEPIRLTCFWGDERECRSSRTEDHHGKLYKCERSTSAGAMLLKLQKGPGIGLVQTDGVSHNVKPTSLLDYIPKIKM